MAFRLPRRPNCGHAWLSGRGGFVAAALLGTIAAGSGAIGIAEAQVVVGANRAPSVSVDNSVLDSLGPSPTLPQYFGARPPSESRATRSAIPPTRSATSSRPQKRRVASHRPKPRAEAAPKRRVATAEKSRSSLHEVIHLTPPGAAHLASAALAPAPAASPRAEAKPAEAEPAAAKVHETTREKLDALAAPVPKPAPMPPLPTSGEIPSTPALPPEPAHEVTPTATPAPAQTASAPTPAVPPTSSRAPAATAAAPAPTTQAPTTSVAAAPAPVPSPGPAPATAATATPLAPKEAAAAAPPPAAAAPVQMAAATTTGNGMSAIRFGAGVTDLPAGPQAALDAIAARLLADDNLRVQVVAHATGKPDDAMEARRVSLARAVAVRAYLIDKGVRSLRIDVRALGNRADDGPVADQVDLVLVSQ